MNEKKEAMVEEKVYRRYEEENSLRHQEGSSRNQPSRLRGEGGGGEQKRKRARSHVNKMAEVIYKNQRSWRKGRETQGLGKRAG